MKTAVVAEDDDSEFFPDPRPRIPITSTTASENESESNPGNLGHIDHLDHPAVYLNDVSRMSAYPHGTPVSKIFFPRCEADVMDIVQAAHYAKKQVGIRGTKHSMGGHSIASQQGWEIDCKFLRSMQYEKSHERVRCGPGCLWSDLIQLLNAHGKSPRTMQSYCSFSVGGTLAVNAHGITTDYCFAESVLEFRLVRVNSKGEAKVVVCRPPPPEKPSSSSSSSKSKSKSMSTSSRSISKSTPKSTSSRSMSRSTSSSSSSSNLGNELFGLALGGYGLFGVITEVVLKVEDNIQLELNTMHSLKVQPPDDLHEDCQPAEFVRIYDNCRNLNRNMSSKNVNKISRSSSGVTTRASGEDDDDDNDNDDDDNDDNDFCYDEDNVDDNNSLGLGKVELKLARLNIVNLEKASLYVFRRKHSSSTVSELPASPRELSPTSRLLYKWAMPLLKELRYEKEESTGSALDWTNEDGSSRNQLLFESAVPLSMLYNPLVTKDDTFVLQEFFCPHDKFSQWIDAVKPIYKDIEDQQKGYKHELILLNTTIRYVERDETTFLSYSRVPGGVFAFVLYFRINRNEAAEKRLGDFHNRLAEVTVSLGGTFYLPYRKCYSPKLLKAAYPMIDKFAEKKELLDPNCVFSNLWFEHYVLPLCSQSYRTKWTDMNMASDQKLLKEGSSILSIPQIRARRRGDKIISTEKEFLRQLPRRKQKNILRRKNSYRNLLRNKELSFQFREQFLVQIFNLADPEEVMRVMVRAAWDPMNSSDIHIYKCIYNHFHGDKGNALNLKSLPQLWRGIQQLRQQKDELTRQTLSVVSKLGMLGKIENYVCMGDNGKTLLDFANKLNICGKLWVVHDVVYNNTLPPINVVLERGSIESVAHEELAYDYILDKADEKLHVIASGSIDLVTINQGLHHIPLEHLFDFLNQILRMLKPGGLFIIREHDLKLTPNGNSSDGKAEYPMLDLAHSVFNAVTGVSVKDEIEEIRAFRSILEWRKILESVGFEDTLVYEIEDGDPTWDEMLCFCKPKDSIQEGGVPVSFREELSSKKDQAEPPIVELISTLLSQVPDLTATNASKVLQYLSQSLPKVQNKLSDLVLVAIPYIIIENEFFGSQSRKIAKQAEDILEPIITNFFRQILGFVDGALGLLADSEINSIVDFKNLVRTTEIYLLIPYLHRKVQSAPNDASEMEKKVIGFLEEYLPSLLPQKPKKHSDRDLLPSENTLHNNSNEEDGFISGGEVQAFVMELAETLPSLLDTKAIMLQSGFSLTQQASLVSQFGGNDLPSACSKLASSLDRRTWTELKTELTAAVSTGDLPTKSRLLDNEPETHPWHASLKIFFKSPKVILNEKAMFGLRLIGLGKVGSIYKEVKKDVEAQELQPSFISQYDNTFTSHLESTDLSINDMTREWADDIVKRTITYNLNSVQENDLWDVAEVIEAKFGYKSITSRKVDVTKQLQSLHASIHTKLANPEYEFSIPDDVQIGWLPIYEDLLISMRNKGNIERELGDILRKSFVNVATLGAAGNNQLKITYRKIRNQPKEGNPRRDSVLNSGHFDDLKLAAKNLCTFLESNDIVRGDLHPDDGSYTWFKLNEWMQVEILDELVKSLEHTPWFRFPFIEFMQTYFKAFQQQCSIVHEKYGLLQAYGSMPFLVDLVPGLVMTILFAQLKLFAIPLQIRYPDGYDSDKSRFLEDVVLHLPLNLDGVNDWDNYLKSTLDRRILKATPLPNNFMVCSLPPFKAMGEVLEKIAIRFPSARVFQISNQFEVQVRVSLLHTPESEQSENRNEVDLQRILSMAGVKLKMDYRYPNTKKGHPSDQGTGPSKTFFCLEVHCLALLDVFRICNSLPNHYVEQVYDFWN